MPAAVKATAVTIASLGVMSAAAFTGRTLVIRRRAGGMVRLAETIPINAAWWREQRARHGELLYVAVGDSTAQGIGASRPGRSYVGMLARVIRHHTSRSVRVVNLSQSGARLREALEKQVPALAKLKPDIVTVSLGANDVADFDAERFERELRDLCAALPSTAIIADLPSFYYGEAQRRVKKANEIVRSVCAEFGLTIAPLHRVTHVRTAARTALRDVAADFFHPNDRGYAVWASAFEPLLTKALQRFK